MAALADVYALEGDFGQMDQLDGFVARISSCIVG